MISYKRNDVRIDLTLMTENFQSLKGRDVFLDWFLLALRQAQIINKLRSVEVCPRCKSYITLGTNGKKISSYEYRIPNGEFNIVINSSILHLVSVHNLVPDTTIVSALENLYCKPPEY